MGHDPLSIQIAGAGGDESRSIIARARAIESRGLHRTEAPFADAIRRAGADCNAQTLVEALLQRCADQGRRAGRSCSTKSSAFPLVDDTYFDKFDGDTLALVPKAFDMCVAHRVSCPCIARAIKLFVAAVRSAREHFAVSEVGLRRAPSAHRLCGQADRPCCAPSALRYNAPEVLLVPEARAKKPKAKLEPTVKAAKKRHVATGTRYRAHTVATGAQRCHRRIRCHRRTRCRRR